MPQLKRALVISLETLDTVLDWVPSASLSLDREDQTLTIKVYRRGDWGCRLSLAARSEELDRRWETGVWHWVQS